MVATGDGCAVVEPWGWSGTDNSTLERLSAGTDVVSVLRHNYACDYFHYAADGIEITAFDPTAPEHRFGADTDRLAGLMREFGLPNVFVQSEKRRVGGDRDGGSSPRVR